MPSDWLPQIFMTCEGGASSAFEPELIPDNQLAWLRNGVIRGGKAQTRPAFVERLVLPEGLFQGCSFFSIQGGMIIMQIAGALYRIRIDGNLFSYEAVPIFNVDLSTDTNSDILPHVWMQETSGSLVIQDGLSAAIIYDGSTARRANPANSEVPLGKMMAYGNGRLWVAIRDNEVIAGDIKTTDFQSELRFTETKYLTGGGAFYFPRKITGLAFIPATGAAGYGSLLVFSKDRTESIRADVANRDLWQYMPGFIQPILLNTGAAGQFSAVEVNQDLYWRDGQGGIRSLRSAVASEASGPGNTPISREVSRIVEFEDLKRLSSVSAIQFNDRMLMTASPFINENNGTSFKNIISLDFSPISSNRGKSAPSYDGQWDGVYFQRLVKGEFNGTARAFAISLDSDGKNRLWEITEESANDKYFSCQGTSVEVESRAPMVIEYPSRDWGDPKRRKILRRCDVYLYGISGHVDAEVYWRADNSEKWLQWDNSESCSTMTDSSTESPHVWKNIKRQERPQIISFTIPYSSNEITGRANHVGFDFQIRVVIRGMAKVKKTVVYASMLDEEVYSDGILKSGDCQLLDVTGNEIPYLMEPSECNAMEYFIDTSFLSVVGQPQDLYMWVRTSSTTRSLVHIIPYTSYTVGDIIDISAQFSSSEITGLSGVEREIFFTYSQIGCSFAVEVRMNTNFTNNVGSMQTETWANVPSAPSYFPEGWSNVPSNLIIVKISNYLQSSCTFTCSYV